MSMSNGTVYSGALVVLCTVGSVIAPAQAAGQRPRSLPVAAMNVMFDSVERVVLSSASCSHRSSALAAIAVWGWARGDTMPPPPPYPGIVARLERIYRLARDCNIRENVTGLMIQQAEREDAVMFLAGVAQEPVPPSAPPPPGVAIVVDDAWPVQVLAIDALTHMGQPGESTLRRLHAEGTVQERTARANLERLARQGFRRQ